MTSNQMHPDQLNIDKPLVEKLIREQFPEWARLLLQAVPSGGTENAIYRLGNNLAIRLPLLKGKDDQIDKDFAWLPKLAKELPLPLPEPVNRGAATKEYPSSWSVCRWLPGETANFESLIDPVETARTLAHFLKVLHRIDSRDGPAPGRHNFYRGVSLAQRDDYTRKAIAQSEGLVDTSQVTELWERDLGAAPWEGPPVWIHGDLSPENMLATGGRLSGVIDWGGLGVGDPAADLLPAWDLFSGESRMAFREAMGADDAMWARGRGLALSIAIVQLPYYIETNPTMVKGARAMIDQVQKEHDTF